MLKRIHILILSLILAAFLSPSTFAMRRTARVIAPAATNAVRNQIKPTWSSLKTMPQLSRAVPTASSRMYHTGMFDTDACRLKDGYLKNKNLVLPSLKKRWYASKPNQKYDELMVERAVLSYQQKDLLTYNSTIDFLLDEKRLRYDLLGIIYNETHDSNLKEYATHAGGKAYQDRSYEPPKEQKEPDSEAKRKSEREKIVFATLIDHLREIIARHLYVDIPINQKDFPKKGWFEYDFDYRERVANYIVTNMKLGMPELSFFDTRQIRAISKGFIKEFVDTSLHDGSSLKDIFMTLDIRIPLSFIFNPQMNTIFANKIETFLREHKMASSNEDIENIMLSVKIKTILDSSLDKVIKEGGKKFSGIFKEVIGELRKEYNAPGWFGSK